MERLRLKKQACRKLIFGAYFCGIEPAKIELCNRVAKEIFGEKPNFEFAKYRES